MYKLLIFTNAPIVKELILPLETIDDVIEWLDKKERTLSFFTFKNEDSSIGYMVEKSKVAAIQWEEIKEDSDVS